MYCTNCGKKLKEENGICENCSSKKEKSNKCISILGVIFSFIIPIIGFILSLIGLIKGSKIEKNTGSKNKYFALNLTGLILSIVIFIVQIIIGIVILLVIVGISPNRISGNYECSGSLYSSLSTVEMRLGSDKSFVWGKYGSVSDNKLSGKYRINSMNSTNGSTTYTLKIKINDYIVNGENKSLSNDEIYANIYTSKNNKNYLRMYLPLTGKTYYCTRKN